MAASLARAPT